MYKVKITEKNNSTIIREPEYKNIEQAKKIANTIFDLLTKEVDVEIIDMETGETIYKPEQEENENG